MCTRVRERERERVKEIENEREKGLGGGWSEREIFKCMHKYMLAHTACTHTQCYDVYVCIYYNTMRAHTMSQTHVRMSSMCK